MEKLVPVPTLQRCDETLPAAPGQLDSLDLTTPAEDPACPAQFEFCALPAEAGKLLDWVSDAKAWIRDASISCGLEPAPPPNKEPAP